jgi:hypothetical protein
MRAKENETPETEHLGLSDSSIVDGELIGLVVTSRTINVIEFWFVPLAGAIFIK